MVLRETHMPAVTLARLCRGGAGCSCQESGNAKEDVGELHLEGTRLKPEV